MRDEIAKILSTIERDRNKKLVLILRGLEKSIGVFGDYPPILADLNFVRDVYSSSVPHPILFILPDYAITRIAQFAPDFWSWKSGVFRFQTTQIAIKQAFTQFVEDDRNINQKLELSEKQERIDLLERLLMEYRPSGQQIAKENLQTCINLLQELGVAYFNRRKFIKAREYLAEALQVCQESGDHFSQAFTYGKLGMIAQEQRNYEEATAYYQKSLKIYEDAQDFYNAAREYHQLGMVAQKQRNYELATVYYQKALKIYEDAGDFYNAADEYHKLGIVAQEQRNYESATAYYQKSLQIYEDAQDFYNAADEYKGLGSIAREQGDLETAANYTSHVHNLSFIESLKPQS